MDTFFPPIEKLEKYIETGVPPKNVHDFVNTSFDVAQKLKFGRHPHYVTDFLLALQNKINNDPIISDMCKQDPMLKNKCEAFNKIMQNNLHIYGGKRRRTIRRKRNSRRKTKNALRKSR